MNFNDQVLVCLKDKMTLEGRLIELEDNRATIQNETYTFVIPNVERDVLFFRTLTDPNASTDHQDGEEVVPGLGHTFELVNAPIVDPEPETLPQPEPNLDLRARKLIELRQAKMLEKREELQRKMNKFELTSPSPSTYHSLGIPATKPDAYLPAVPRGRR